MLKFQGKFIVDAQKATHNHRLSQRTPIIHACRPGGMTLKAWCQENSYMKSSSFTGNVEFVNKSVHFLLNYQQPNIIQLLFHLKGWTVKSVPINILGMIWFYVLAALSLNFQIRHHQSLNRLQ
ncbi:MAG: hypothetical protein ACYDG2_25060 [Ruminiclostridium sp.]